MKCISFHALHVDFMVVVAVMWRKS